MSFRRRRPWERDTVDWKGVGISVVVIIFVVIMMLMVDHLQHGLR